MSPVVRPMMFMTSCPDTVRTPEESGRLTLDTVNVALSPGTAKPPGCV
jgi:hypothetical protein